MMLRIAGVALNRSPRLINDAVVVGDTLLAMITESVEHEGKHRIYSFAIYHPKNGWKAYWVEEDPYSLHMVRPVNQHMIWVVDEEKTGRVRLSLVHLEDDATSRVVVSISPKLVHAILYADEKQCYTIAHDTLSLVRLLKDGEEYDDIDLSKQYNLELRPLWVHKLEDGTMVVGGKSSLGGALFFIESPGGYFYQNSPLPICHPPFILYHDNDNIFFSLDPRLGWQKAAVFGHHKESVSEAHEYKIALFAEIADAFYVGLKKHLKNSLGLLETDLFLYRFPKGNPEDIELVKTFKFAQTVQVFALYNRLICFTSAKPIHCNGRLYDRGLLVWEPLSDVLHTELPLHPLLTFAKHHPHRSIAPPAAWFGNAPQTQTHSR